MLSGKSQCQLLKNPVHYEIGVYICKVCYISKLHKSDIIVEQTTLKTLLEEY